MKNAFYFILKAFFDLKIFNLNLGGGGGIFTPHLVFL